MEPENGFQEKFETAKTGGKNSYWTADKELELPIRISEEE